MAWSGAWAMPMLVPTLTVAQNLMFGYVAQFLYEGDSPLAERRAAALSLDPELLGLLFGTGLDAAGKPRITLADALVANGLAVDRNEVFSRWLHNGSAYYEPHYAVETAEAVRLVRAAGGVGEGEVLGAHDDLGLTVGDVAPGRDRAQGAGDDAGRRAPPPRPTAAA